MKRSFKDVRVRLTFCGFFFLVLFGAVGFRAFQLQILEGDAMKRLGERQYRQEVIVLPKRGAVMDRYGEALALSVEAQSAYVRPRRIKEPGSLVAPLARILGLHRDEVQKKLTTNKPFAWLKRQITPQEAQNIKALNVDGIGMFFEPRRFYPQGAIAGQLIGFVGKDSQGLEGLEQQYDRYLRGEMGTSVVERDALGRRIFSEGIEEIQIPPGADIHLTLDTSIQYLAENHLEAAVKKYRAKAGTAVVVEPFTGEVLAIANHPFFNPNDYSRQTKLQWRNRAVTDSYEPGSTFKTILAAAALEEGVVGKEDLFYCEYGKYAFAGRTIHDTHEYGCLPFYKIIQYSSIIGVTKVAEKLKEERFHNYIKSFGFGRLSGIDLPGEAAGVVRPSSQWYPIDLATHAFGQGIAVTPIQLAMAYAAVANGGMLMRPFIVKKIVGPDGQVLLKKEPHVVRRVISEKTAHLLTSILKGVVLEGGTGTKAALDGFEVAGKTGTAQKVDEHGGYAARKRIASFVGFVPAEDPRLVLLVIVDEPEANVYGGVVAAPVFRNIAEASLRRLAVAPQNQATVPGIDDRSEVTLTRIAATVSSPLKVEEPKLPDFTGMSLREVLLKTRSLKLVAEIHGHGYVVKQLPQPGADLEKTDKVVLNLQG